MWMISREQYLYFSGRALHGMIEMWRSSATTSPIASRPCLARTVPTRCSTIARRRVLLGGDWWLPTCATDRTPSSPLRACSPLIERARRSRTVSSRRRGFLTAEPLHGKPRTDIWACSRLDQGGALLHIYEELLSTTPDGDHARLHSIGAPAGCVCDE